MLAAVTAKCLIAGSLPKESSANQYLRCDRRVTEYTHYENCGMLLNISACNSRFDGGRISRE